MPNTTARKSTKGAPRTKKPERTASTTLTIRKGRKWTYVYNSDGSLVAEIRNDAVHEVSGATAAGLAVAS